MFFRQRRERRIREQEAKLQLQRDVAIIHAQGIVERRRLWSRWGIAAFAVGGFIGGYAAVSYTYPPLEPLTIRYLIEAPTSTLATGWVSLAQDADSPEPILETQSNNSPPPKP